MIIKFRGGSLQGSKNMLGKLLMELRDKVKKQRKVIPLADEQIDACETADDHEKLRARITF